jgi:Protein of unknown function (DUF1091)
MRLEFDKVLITFNAKYLDGRYCLQNTSGFNEIFVYFNMKVLVRGPVVVSSVHFNETRHRNLNVFSKGTFQLLHETDNGHYMFTMPPVSMELCSMMKNVGKFPLFEEFLMNLKQYAKFPFKCPFMPVNTI